MTVSVQQAARQPRLASPSARGQTANLTPTTIDRLRPVVAGRRFADWPVTVLVAAIALMLRLVNLGYPNKFIFDETYYAKDAWALLQSGYEREWPKDANAAITAGNTDVIGQAASFIVHPPVGKWLIAVGEQLFGMTSFGWRVMPLLFGTLLVIVTIRLVRRVSQSALIGCTAGLLLALDGLHFVMSRIALLDIFLAFFTVAAVACLVADRDWFRARLADHLDRTGLLDLGGRFGPALWWRPWRLAAGVCWGLALGTKWSAIYLMAAFCLLSVAWDVGARRLAGARHPWQSLARDGLPAFLAQVPVAAIVYVSSWAGWLATTGGYDRSWGEQHTDSLAVRLLGKPLGSLLHYHQEIYRFHTGDYIASQTHTYDAHPIGWLFLGRPTGIDAVNSIQPGTDGCLGPDNCIRVISAIGTPALWWGAMACLLVAVVLWVGSADWRFGIPVVGVLAAWLPWFQYSDRPQFFFYAIVIIPFSVMAVALCLGKLIGPANSGDRRMLGAVLAGAYVALVGANFAYLYPILTDELLPYPQWLARMWFRTWI